MPHEQVPDGIDRESTPQRTTVPVGPLLTGRTAIVTGGGSGIGRGIADAFADHGANVVIADVDGDFASESAAAIKERGGSAIGITADVRLRADCERTVAEALDRFGAIRVLVNNVGHPGVRDSRSFHETTEDAWPNLHAMNFGHILLMSQAVLPHMVRAGLGGSIINVTTVEAHRGIPYMAVYGAYKAAASHFTKSLAVDVGRHGIRVNEIAPDMNEVVHQIPLATTLTDEERDALPLYIPLGRMGTGADSGGVALFLASDLSAYVTGTCIYQDGGTIASSGWYRSADPDARRLWTNTPRVP